MASRKTYLRVITLAVVALTVAVWTARRPEAIVIVGGMPAHFGPASLVRNQAVRFYLANAAMDMMAESCVADVMVHDMMGTMVGEPRRLEAMAGETTFFDVFFDVFMPMRGQDKVVFRLVAEQPPDPNQPPDPDESVPAGEPSARRANLKICATIHSFHPGIYLGAKVTTDSMCAVFGNRSMPVTFLSS
jgi:hypothetical protein